MSDNSPNVEATSDSARPAAFSFHIGAKTPKYSPGRKQKPSLYSCADQNLALRILDAILNLKIVYEAPPNNPDGSLGTGTPYAQLTEQGLTLVLPPMSSSGASLLTPMYVSALAGTDGAADYMTCNPFNAGGGVNSSVTYSVAKPFLLQRSFWNGKTVTFINGNQWTIAVDEYGDMQVTASDPSHSGHTYTWPAVETIDWFVGDTILASQINGSTGIIDGSGRLCTWIDTNNAGRRFMFSDQICYISGQSGSAAVTATQLLAEPPA